MRFGIREVCDLNFVKQGNGVGPTSFIIESAKMTTLEGASSTVYAQGGKGNSRLIAWEGEKTITFTVEDALITLDTFWALTGATKKDTIETFTDNEGIAHTTGVGFSIKTTSFAATYSVTADTLFRDEEGNDRPAIIKIPRAKLQTTLNLSMAPTGDPSTFTFTFDALPVNNELFSVNFYDIDDDTTTTTLTTVYINGTEKTTNATSPVLTVDSTKNITLGGVDTGLDLSDNEILTNFSTDLSVSDSITLAKGSTTRWYII